MDDLPTAIVVNDEAETPPADDQMPHIEPDRPERSAYWVDLLIAVAIIWSVELALGLALVLAAGGPDLSRVPVGLLATSLLATGATVAVSWAFVCWKYGKSFSEGFAIARVPRRAVLWSIAVGAAAAVVASLILSAAPEGDSLMTKLMRRPDGLLVLVTIAILLPPFEEIYYRGFLYPVLAKHLGGVAAVVVVAIWFGAAHVGQLAGDWLGIPIVFTMGVIWTVMRHRSGSVVPGMVCHLTYNLGLVALTLLSLYCEHAESFL